MNHPPHICPHCGAPSAPKLLVAHIQAVVASYYGIDVRKMTSAQRGRRYSHPRQVAMYLAIEMTPKSYPDVGRRFERDHTTVIWAVRAVQHRMAEDAEIAEDIRILRERLQPVEQEAMAA